MALLGAAVAVGCGLGIEGAATAPDDAGTGVRDDGQPQDDAAAADAADLVDAATLDADSDATSASDGVDGVDAGPIGVVQTANAAKSGTTTLSTTIAATQSGSLLVVLSTYYGVTPTITGIADDAPGGSNTYVSASLRSVTGTCQASEIWYARNARAGAKSVTVTTSGSVTLQVWVVELSNTRTTGGVDVGNVGSGAASTTITAPTVTPSGVPAVVVSALGSCGTMGSLAGGSPFTALPIQNGNGAAYYIATAPGAFGPVYNNSNNAWNASVAAFR
jgi:hypothetical protein